jgi:hypothetical protein
MLANTPALQQIAWHFVASLIPISAAAIIERSLKLADIGGAAIVQSSACRCGWLVWPTPRHSAQGEPLADSDGVVLWTKQYRRMAAGRPLVLDCRGDRTNRCRGISAR